ncbi:nucleoside-diphosphate kinase [bacterium]|nr:nucleoside-diphosphate kinase [bacterium]
MKGKNEQTLVLIKPDGVMRGLIGEIIKRFERSGLKIIALKMSQPSKDFVASHYSGSEEWLRGMGKKALNSFAEYNIDTEKEMGTSDPLEIGRMIQQWNVDYLSMGPVVAMVIEGTYAITAVRKIIGFTIPAQADVGTIRGDFSIDSNNIANVEKRSTKNLIHAAGDEEEAAHEIKHWFSDEELVSYERCDANVMF